MQSDCSYRGWTIAGLVVGLMGAIGVMPTAAAADDGRPPNVIVILVDDLGWMDLSCQGSRYYETPNVDRLAAEGMRFTDGYAACAVCSPSRYAVMTGRYPARGGITDWIRARWNRGSDRNFTEADRPPRYQARSNKPLLCPNNRFWMEHEEVTIAELLKPLGYATCHIGKWHLGDKGWWPESQGFDVNIAGCDYGQPPTYYSPYERKRGDTVYALPNLEPRQGQYLTDREGEEAVKFITANQDKPFFLHMAHYAVHTPIQGRPDLVEKYKAKPLSGQKNPAYAAMIESVDHATGRILATLDELKLADKTLVIFTSDNGGLSGVTNNAPLRSGKGFPYEGGVRVPFIVRYPPLVKPGQVSDLPVVGCDIFPTVAELTAARTDQEREIDAVSLVAHLKSGGREKPDRDALFWHFPHYRGNITPYAIVRQGDYKLIRWFEGREELYNLKDDLGEKTDLIDVRIDVANRLRGRLDQFFKDTDACLPKPNPNRPSP